MRRRTVGAAGSVGGTLRSGACGSRASRDFPPGAREARPTPWNLSQTAKIDPRSATTGRSRVVRKHRAGARGACCAALPQRGAARNDSELLASPGPAEFASGLFLSGERGPPLREGFGGGGGEGRGTQAGGGHRSARRVCPTSALWPPGAGAADGSAGDCSARMDGGPHSRGPRRSVPWTRTSRRHPTRSGPPAAARPSRPPARAAGAGCTEGRLPSLRCRAESGGIVAAVLRWGAFGVPPLRSSSAAPSAAAAAVCKPRRGLGARCPGRPAARQPGRPSSAPSPRGPRSTRRRRRRRATAAIDSDCHHHHHCRVVTTVPPLRPTRPAGSPSRHPSPRGRRAGPG